MQAYREKYLSIMALRRGTKRDEELRPEEPAGETCLRIMCGCHYGANTSLITYSDVMPNLRAFGGWVPDWRSP